MIIDDSCHFLLGDCNLYLSRAIPGSLSDWRTSGRKILILGCCLMCLAICFLVCVGLLGSLQTYVREYSMRVCSFKTIKSSCFSFFKSSCFLKVKFQETNPGEAAYGIGDLVQMTYSLLASVFSSVQWGLQYYVIGVIIK